MKSLLKTLTCRANITGMGYVQPAGHMQPLTNTSAPWCNTVHPALAWQWNVGPILYQWSLWAKRVGHPCNSCTEVHCKNVKYNLSFHSPKAKLVHKVCVIRSNPPFYDAYCAFVLYLKFENCSRTKRVKNREKYISLIDIKQ